MTRRGTRTEHGRGVGARAGPTTVLSLLVVACVFAASAAAVAPVAADGAQSTVTVAVVGPDTVTAGETATYRVVVDADRPVYGAQFALTYDPSSLAVEDVAQGSFLSRDGSSFVVANRIDRDAGQVEYGESRRGGGDGVAGRGTLATVTVRAPAGATGETDLRLTDVTLADDDGSPIPAAARNATVTVAAGGDAGTDHDAGDGSDGDRGTAADGTDSTDTDGNAGDADAGRAAVDPAVRLGGERPVLVTLAPGANASAVAERVRAAGGADVRRVEGGLIVDLPSSAVGAVARARGVERLVYAGDAAQARGLAHVRAARAGPGSVTFDAAGGTVLVSLPATAAGNRSGVVVSGLSFRAGSAVRAEVTTLGASAGGVGPVPGVRVLSYFEVNHSAPVENASFRFAVDRSTLDERGLDPGNVSLYRYDGSGWTRLNTTALGTTDERAFYVAASPGLSTFAVAGGSALDATTGTATGTPTPTAGTGGTDDGGAASPTAAPPESPTPSASGGPGFTTLAALVALAAAALLAGRDG